MGCSQSISRRLMSNGEWGMFDVEVYDPNTKKDVSFTNICADEQRFSHQQQSSQQPHIPFALPSSSHTTTTTLAHTSSIHHHPAPISLDGLTSSSTTTTKSQQEQQHHQNESDSSSTFHSISESKDNTV